MPARADLRRAKVLLDKIPSARSDQRRRMLMAAAVTALMSRAPIVVGGTAEAYWSGDRYYPTDLDLCPRPGPEDVAALASVGLRKVGRHWMRDGLPVALEFPGEGDDIERTVDTNVDGVTVRVIAAEDLYLDRVRQATASWPREDVSFDSALEIALTNYEKMDWPYISVRIANVVRAEKSVGTTMRMVNRRLRARARRGRARVEA